MTGTSSRTARVSRVIVNLTEAAGKLPARGTRTGYEAMAWWARGRKDSKPNVIQTESAYIRRVCGRKVTRLTLRDLPWCFFEDTSEEASDFERSCLLCQKSAEAIVSRLLNADQGPNCLTSVAEHSYVR